MRLDYLNPIVDSAIAVLTECTGTAVERGDMSLNQTASPTRDVAAIIGMAGEVEGRVILEMSRDTALSMASQMNQQQLSDLSPLALDTLMELTNMIVARGVSALNDNGFTFRLTPPMIFTGANLCFFSNLNIETLAIPLQISAGEVTLNVALRMNEF